MTNFLKPIVKYGLLIALIIVGTLVAHLLSFQYAPVSLEKQDHVFLIKSGSNIKAIAEKLTAMRIIEDPWLFILLAKLKGVETRVRAGEYQISTGQTPNDLLNLFSKGSSLQYSFTVIEGWTFRQMLSALATDPILEHRLTGKSDQQIMQALGYPGQHPEGLFFPDTYRFPKGSSDIDFLRRAYQVMQNHLQQEWQQRELGLPLKTSYDALILASIIEKETGAGHERPLIAGVFTQRLNKKMRLQTDPTIIYGMGSKFDGDIRSRDLKKDTPYNTYLHSGLTPTPIALPGLDSIRAALNPAKTTALYFVSKGDGTHQFSETLKQHNAAVRRYQLGGKN